MLRQDYLHEAGMVLFAITPKDIVYQFALVFFLLWCVCAVVRLFDWLGFGFPKPSQWRFVGLDRAGQRAASRRLGVADDEDDPFEVLQIGPTDDLDRISAAYIKLAKKTHPDLNQNDKWAKQKFQRLQMAFSRVGSQSALRLYLIDHPLEQTYGEVVSVSRDEVVSLDVFQRDLASFRAAWRLKQAVAEKAIKYLQGPTPPGFRMLRKVRSLLGRRRRRPPRTIMVDRVCFLSEGSDRGAKVPHLQVFGKLLRVGTQKQLHAVITFLLGYNGVFFADQFHTGNTVSFHDVGRIPGRNAALRPTGTYVDFVTNLAKLGLYEGPDVQRFK